jgi:hypothetical protein
VIVMPEQSYKRHAHHPVQTYLAGAFALTALIGWLGAVFWGWNSLSVAVGGLIGAVWVLVSISRRYIVRLQDRIIMLEMKVRCAEVLPAGEDAKLAQLSRPQIVALRFASDAELGPLLDRIVREKLSRDEIKKAIQTWRPDFNRT